MKKQILAATAAVAVTLGGSASAATYISYFDYSNTGSGGGVVKRAGVASDSNAWGKATIVEGVNQLSFTVELFDAAGFVNTGSSGQNDKKAPFTFNMDAAYTVIPSNANDPNPSDANNQTFFYEANSHKTPATGYENNPFGVFTDYIGCCYSPGNIQNGSVAASPSPLKFTILGNGITVANLFSNTSGTDIDGNGPTPKGGWWFAADVTTALPGASTSGQTFTIAARDIRVLAVPEPTTWALMIMGFGGAGAMLRRRKAALA